MHPMHIFIFPQADAKLQVEEILHNNLSLTLRFYNFSF